MEQISYLNLHRRLGNKRNWNHLQLDPLCLIYRNNPIAWLLPLDSKPDAEIIGYVSMPTFRSQISFHVDMVRQSESNSALCLTINGGEECCYLVTNPDLVNLTLARR